MQFLSKLSNKFKILILVIYSLVAILIAFLIVSSGTKTKLLTGYSNQASDEYIKASFRIYENRQSSRQLDSDNESSVYRMYAYVEKITPEAKKSVAINNIKIYVAGENSEGTKLFDEPSSSTEKNISFTGKQTTFESNILPNNIFVRKVTTENDKEVVVKNDPKKLYIKVLYRVEVKDEEDSSKNKVENKELKYTVDLTDGEKQDTTKLNTRKIGSNSYVTNDGEPFDLKIVKTITTNTSSSNTIQKDRFTFTTSLNSSNLGSNKIEKLTIEVFGKVKNDPKDEKNVFSETVRMYTYTGSVITSAYSTVSAELDQQYEISELYVVAIYNFVGGTKNTVTYKINL